MLNIIKKYYSTAQYSYEYIRDPLLQELHSQFKDGDCFLNWKIYKF